MPGAGITSSRAPAPRRIGVRCLLEWESLMTELEFQRAKRAREQMTRRTLWEKVISWMRGLAVPMPASMRRAALDRKAEVECKARQSL